MDLKNYTTDNLFDLSDKINEHIENLDEIYDDLSDIAGEAIEKYDLSCNIDLMLLHIEKLKTKYEDLFSDIEEALTDS